MKPTVNPSHDLHTQEQVLSSKSKHTHINYAVDLPVKFLRSKMTGLYHYPGTKWMYSERGW